MDCNIDLCAVGVSKNYFDNCCDTPQGRDVFVRNHLLEARRLLNILSNNHHFRDQSPLLKTVNSVLSTAQDDSNYFQLLMQFIRNERYPPVSSSTYVILICFGALHSIILVSCFVTLVWPFLNHSSNQRSKRFWLVKSIPTGGLGRGWFRSVPLILINGGALVAFSQVMESTVSIVYICLTYLTSQSVEFAESTTTRPWACAMALFQFYSCWFMAWTLLYTRLCTRNPYIDRIGSVQGNARRMFHPLLLNIFFSSVPLVVTAASGIMIYELTISSNHLSDEWRSLTEALKSGAVAWEFAHDNRTSISPGDALRFRMDILTSNLESFVQGVGVSIRLRRHIIIDRIESYLWVFVLSGTCLVYTFCYWTLLSLISSGIHRFKGRVEIGLISTKRNNSGATIARNPAHAESHEPRSPPSTRGNISVSPAQASIKRGFLHLALHGAAMILAMLTTIGVRITLAIVARNLNWQASWRAVGGWLVLVSGTFAALATSFQCIRTILDFDILIPLNPENAQDISGNYNPVTAPQNQFNPPNSDGKLSVANFESDKYAPSLDVYQ